MKHTAYKCNDCGGVFTWSAPPPSSCSWCEQLARIGQRPDVIAAHMRRRERKPGPGQRGLWSLWLNEDMMTTYRIALGGAK